MTLGQVRPDAGEVFIGGIPVGSQRSRALARVGAIFETPAFYDYLSGWTNLRMLVAYSGHVPDAKLHETIELVGLTERINDRVRVYSHGMRQRLALAQALLPDPAFILLDEPSEGLDPEGIEEMRRLILRLREERGLTVMLSSHLLSEVELLCDRVAILNQGRLTYCGAWSETAAAQRRVRWELDDWTLATAPLERAGAKFEAGGVTILPESADIAAIVADLVGTGVRVSAVETGRASLEDFYLERTRRE